MALRLLLRRRSEAPKTSTSIFTEIRRSIVEARSLSAIAGVSRLRAEAASAGVKLDRLDENTLASAATSIRRADRIASNFAERWENAGGSQSPRLAAAATKSRLEQIAATESAESFNSARARYLREQPSLGLLFRVWDATLDRRTCPICSSADGTIVGAREHFPQGEPGAVHPWCRCTWHLLTPSEARRTSAAQEPEPEQPITVESTVTAKQYAEKKRIVREFIDDDSAEARSLRRYVATSAPVNHYLRERAAGAARDDAAEAEVEKIKLAMRQIRARGGGITGTVLRGETVDAERFHELATAETLQYHNFVSTTISRREAEEFTGSGRRAMIVIQGAEGIPLGGIGPQGGSREVLLEPGAFSVLRREVEGDTITLLVKKR